jgi:hypothetical protein
MFDQGKDLKLFLLTRDGSYWVAEVQHNGWEVIEEFVWFPDKTENIFIDWLERLIAESKITVADAIRAGVYYGQR